MTQQVNCVKNNWKIYNQKLLIDKLTEEFEGLVWVDEKVRRGKGKDTYRYPLGYLIYFARKIYSGYYKHNIWDEYTSVSYKTLQNWFGREYHDITDILLVHTEDWSHGDKITRGWKLNDRCRKVFDEYFSREVRQKQTNKLLGLDGRVLKTFPRHGIIKSVNRDGLRLRKEEKMENNINNTTEVNFDNIQKCIDIIREIKDTGRIGKENYSDYTKPLLNIDPDTLTEIRNDLTDLRDIADSELLPKGKIYQHYFEGDSGRVYTTGNTSIQQMNRIIRPIVMGGLGYWDYDIQNCHFTLMKHIAEYYGYKKMDSIELYLKEKTKIRKRLSLLVDEDMSIIKQILLSILYGSSQTIRKGNAVTDLVGGKKQSELNADAFVDKLYKDIKGLTEHIVGITETDRHKHPYLKMHGQKVLYYENIRHKRLSVMGENGKKTPGRKILAHILQGLESKILDVIMGKVGGNIKVLIHDGFILEQFVEHKELVKIVKDTLDIDVLFQSIPLECVLQKSIYTNRQ